MTGPAWPGSYAGDVEWRLRARTRDSGVNTDETPLPVVRECRITADRSSVADVDNDLLAERFQVHGPTVGRAAKKTRRRPPSPQLADRLDGRHAITVHRPL